MSKRLVIGVAVLAVLALGSWGAWQGYRALGDSDDASDSPPPRVTAQAQVRSLEQSLVTQGVVGFETIGQATAAAAGRVTAVEVSSGDAADSGDVLLRLDGRPVVAIDGETPFWRDLAQGSRGDDVRALQQILADEGYLSFEPDGRFGSGTETALEEWQDAHGHSDPDGVMQLSDIVVGQWPARVGVVSVRVGDLVNPGDPLLSATSDEAQVSLELLPSDRLQVEAGMAARIEVSATGDQFGGELVDVEVDPVEREGSLYYEATVVAEEEVAVPEGTSVRVTLLLEQAPDVVAVPIGAVVSNEDGDPIVRVENGNGEFENRPVELGLSQGAWVEVSSGVEAGEQVLVAEADATEAG